MVHGPTLVAGPDRLAAETARVAAEISRDHPDGVRLVGVLTGSLVFLADLGRRLSVPASVDFIAVTRFDGVAARTRVVKDLDQSVTGEAVVLVTSVVDTGLTVDFLTRHLAETEPSSVAVATLADRPTRRILPVAPTYVALTVADEHLIGWGLGLAGRFRNASGLWAVDREAVTRDPGPCLALLDRPGDGGGVPR